MSILALINIYCLLRYCSFNCYQFKYIIYTLVFYVSLFSEGIGRFCRNSKRKSVGVNQKARGAYKHSHFVAHMTRMVDEHVDMDMNVGWFPVGRWFVVRHFACLRHESSNISQVFFGVGAAVMSCLCNIARFYISIIKYWGPWVLRRKWCVL